MECFASTAQLLRPEKKAETEHLSSITIGYLASRDGSRKAKHWRRMRVLFDSACAATLVNRQLVNYLEQTREGKTKWRTKAGKFTTTNKCDITFKIITILHQDFLLGIIIRHSALTKGVEFHLSCLMQKCGILLLLCTMPN